MNARKRDFVTALVLLVISGLLIWHAIYWQVSGVYREMFRWLDSDKAYLTVLYNTGFMIVLGLTLGILMNKIIAFSGNKKADSKDKTWKKD